MLNFAVRLRILKGKTWCADGKHPRADASFFQRREFCFTLDGDIFIRYQSFKVSTVKMGPVSFICCFLLNFANMLKREPV